MARHTILERIGQIEDAQLREAFFFSHTITFSFLKALNNLRNDDGLDITSSRPMWIIGRLGEEYRERMEGRKRSLHERPRS